MRQFLTSLCLLNPNKEVCHFTLFDLYSLSLFLQINISTFAFLFSEVVQYNQQRVTSLSQLHEK